ncbi:RHS repeat-associated core domain-containing protein [Microcoleus sp. ARI1-A1]
MNRYSDLSGTGLVAKSEYFYDRGGRLTQLSHGKGNTILANYAWTYDFANRVTGLTSPSGNISYSYDKRDQLTGADYSSGSDESYSYDDNGTRNSSGYQTGSNNQLQSDGVYNYQYDGEGNLTKRTDIVTGEVTEYSWDYRNRLTQVVGKNGGGSVIKSAKYSYDGLNRRIVKEVDADGAGSAVSQFDRLVYDGQQIALTFDGSGNQTHRYLYGVQTDEILADESAGGSVLWPLTDNLGTVRDLVDASGAIQNRIGYDSFGKVRSQTNSSVGFRFGFTGRELDSETGNYYYNSRYYDPQVGRFISEDTIGFGGGDANLYRYVGNSPTNYTDPSGQLIPTAIPVAAPPVAAPPAGGLIPFLRGLGGAGILLAPPGGGGLLNPLPAGQDDRLFQERLRRGLIRPQGQTQPNPVLNPRPTRPDETAPAPAPASAPKSASPTRTPKKKGSNCPTCDDPPFSSYDKCSDLVTNDLPFGGYKDTTINSAVQAMQNFRGKHPLIKDYRELERQEGKGDPADKFKCKNPTGSNHYNVYIKDLLPKKSAGSIAECKCCKEGNPPDLVNRFAILNIKDKAGNKYYNRGF